MKKITFICFLCLVLGFMTMCGCSKKSNAYEDGIKTIISPSTYTDIDFNTNPEIFNKQLDEKLKDYFTEDGLDVFYANRLPTLYADFFKEKNITEVKDIKITEKENKKVDDYVYIICEVSYICKSTSEEIEMKDQYLLNIKDIDNKELISTINVKPEGSSIFSYSKDNK